MVPAFRGARFGFGRIRPPRSSKGGRMGPRHHQKRVRRGRNRGGRHCFKPPGPLASLSQKSTFHPSELPVWEGFSGQLGPNFAGFQGSESNVRPKWSNVLLGGANVKSPNVWQQNVGKSNVRLPNVGKSNVRLGWSNVRLPNVGKSNVRPRV